VIESPSHGTFRALRYRNFQLYLGGMTVSLAGAWMQQLAQSWLVYRLTHSEWMLGLVVFCANLPVLVFSPLAGVAADRFPRRRIVMVTQSVAMLQAAALAALTLSGRVEVWHVLALALVVGTATAFDIPGRQALFIHLVGKQDLLNAISLNSAMFNSARVVGPSLGGIVVARLGEGACFSLNAVSSIAALGALLAMRIEEGVHAPAGGALVRLKDGLAYALGAAPLRDLLVICGLTTMASAPSLALAPMFADGIFHRGSTGLGLLTSAFGVGAVAGTLSLGRRRDTRGLTRVILVSSAAAGLALLVFGVSPSFWLSMALMPLAGMSIFRLNAAINTSIQTRIDDAYRGRIMGLYSMMVIGMIPAGSLLAGALAGYAGSRWTVSLGGLLGLFTAVFVFSRRRRLSDWLERQET
jgi:MFS family permease